MRFLALCLVAMMLLSFGSAAQAAECTSTDKLRVVVWPPTLNDVPFWYARDRGLFEKHCLEVEMVILTKTSEHAVSLSQGDADILTAVTPVEGLLTSPPTEFGHPVLVVSTAKGASYALVGYLPDASTRSLHALLGQRVAVFRCSWQGIGDVTDVTERAEGAEAASPLTDMLITYLHEQIKAGALPQGTRIYCGEPEEGGLRRDTIYLAEIGGGSKRFAELQLAPERNPEDRIAFGMVTVPGHFALVPADGGSDYVVLAYPESFRFSDGYVVAMQKRMADPAFREVLGRFAFASSEAVDLLQNEDEATSYMMELSASGPDGTLSFSNEREARLTAKMGIGMWQVTCPAQDGVDMYITLSGLAAVASYETLIDCLP